VVHLSRGDVGTRAEGARADIPGATITVPPPVVLSTCQTDQQRTPGDLQGRVSAQVRPAGPGSSSGMNDMQ
jgi:hypothetical protein